MERRFRVRLDELVNDARVPEGLLRDVLPRLQSFLAPFVESLESVEQRTNAKHYVAGLLSDLRSKDVESIAYLHDRERQGLQKFIGQAAWEHQPLLAELGRQVGTELGEADGRRLERLPQAVCDEVAQLGTQPVAGLDAGREHHETPQRLALQLVG